MPRPGPAAPLPAGLFALGVASGAYSFAAASASGDGAYNDARESDAEQHGQRAVVWRRCRHHRHGRHLFVPPSRSGHRPFVRRGQVDPWGGPHATARWNGEQMRRRTVGAAIVAAGLAAATLAPVGPVNASASAYPGFAFTPLAGSAYGAATDPGAPWVLPTGFRQYVVAGEPDLDIYPAGNDWPDMNTVNETGRERGRYLYRTHEVRGATDNSSNGAVSVVDLKTGKAKVLVQRSDWDAVDGIRWTPWGTLLFDEETDTGMVYEVAFDRRDPTRAASVTPRPALGVMAHEGMEIGRDGSVYVIDELRGGGIFRFVPDRRGDLSAGQLYALKVDDGGTGLDVGQGSWVPLDRDTVRVSTRAAVAAVNATGAGVAGFQRPEDLERIGDTLYAAITEAEPQAQAAGAASGDGRVVAIDLRSMRVTDFVRAGVNVAAERPPATGLKNPDNLAEGPDGRLWIVEDNSYSDIWVAGRDTDRDGTADTVSLFASLTDATAEGTGIYFGTDPRTLFVNIQHSGTGNDQTIAITDRAPRAGSLAALGDTPYGPAQVDQFPALIDSVNADRDVRLALHAGDIKNGSSVCSDEYFAFIRGQFDRLSDPLVYSPGDNEWTDCHRTAAGKYDPLERLAAVRDVFFDSPGRTLGASVPVAAQRGLPENVRWTRHDVTYAAVHLVGSNNDKLPWFTDDTTDALVDDPARREADVATREAAALAWIDAAFAQARRQRSAAVVLVMQADTWDRYSIDNGLPLDGFTAIVQRIGRRATAFGGPVLLVQGDSHGYLVDRPYTDATLMAVHGVTMRAPNVTRVVVPGSTTSTWLKVGIDTSRPHPWTFQQVTVG